MFYNDQCLRAYIPRFTPSFNSLPLVYVIFLANIMLNDYSLVGEFMKVILAKKIHL